MLSKFVIRPRTRSLARLNPQLDSRRERTTSEIYLQVPLTRSSVISNMLVLTLNCRSIKNKVDEFPVFVESLQPDIAHGSDSRLDGSISDVGSSDRLYCT